MDLVVNSRAVRDDLADVGPAIEWAGAFVDQAGLSPDVRFAVDLSLEEALANLIMHGQCPGPEKDIVLTIATDTHGATITVTDRCAPFDVTQQRPVEDESGLSVGGRGLRLLRAFTGELDYAAGGDRNVLTMRFPAEKALASPA